MDYTSTPMNFGFHHLVQHAKFGHAAEVEDLKEPLKGIEEFWKAEPGTCARRLRLNTASVDSIETQLQVMSFLPQAQRMGRDILTLRRFLAQGNCEHAEPEFLQNEELRLDPTWFSKVNQRYQTIVLSLIQSSADSLPPGVSLQEVEQFQHVYTSSVYSCGYLQCPHYSDGFFSSVGRNIHEKIHTRPLRYADSSCEFYGRSFTSQIGLLEHNRKYHLAPEDPDDQSFPQPEPEDVKGDVSVGFHDSGYGSHVPTDASDPSIKPTPLDSEELPLPEISNEEQKDSDTISLASFTDEINSKVSTRRSPEEVAAEEHLGLLLAQNEEMRRLYEFAISQISKERLIQNLRRLLKQYHLDLCRFAKTNLEKATAHLLRSRWSRVRIAQMISEQVVQRNTGEDLEQPLAEVPRKILDLEAWIAGNAGLANLKIGESFDQVPEEWNGAEPAYDEPSALREDDSSDESDEEANLLTHLLPRISEAHKFLMEGESFLRLLTTFRNFLMPASLSHLTRVCRWAIQSMF
ncbi:hypothetical protein BKA64DRAFT_383297 [Cadophora sp. MPI-SDFR-AT-0126]|nr:hypothetical protein BKA64DRAFT_383297 [Leotiomycetes sp. MPI-SDFR-AT-0126]